MIATLRAAHIINMLGMYSSSSFSFEIHVLPLVGVRLAIIFLHLLRSNFTFSSTPISFKSFFTLSFQVFLGHPTFLFPNTFIFLFIRYNIDINHNIKQDTNLQEQIKNDEVNIYL